MKWLVSEDPKLMNAGVFGAERTSRRFTGEAVPIPMLPQVSVIAEVEGVQLHWAIARVLKDSVVMSRAAAARLERSDMFSPL